MGKNRNNKGRTYHYSPYVPCDHWREPIQIGDKVVVASEYTPGADVLTSPVPDLGIYLTKAWEEFFKPPKFFGFIPKKPYVLPYPAVVLDWSDHDMLPMHELRWIIEVIREAMAEDKLVEIACFGGHGRTGTLLACLVGEIENLTARQAILAIRSRYCEKAVESTSQLRGIAQYLGDSELTVADLERKVFYPSTQFNQYLGQELPSF